MEKYLYLFRLNGKLIDNENVSCLGKQFTKVIEVLNEDLIDYVWYISDISDNENITKKVFGENCISNILKIGSTNELLSQVSVIDQFTSGVFIAISKEKCDYVYFNEIPFTEAEEGLQFQDAVLEIRAFDTYYFEVYTRSRDIKCKIDSAFRADGVILN